jgi:hypothetical protein
MDSGSAQPKPSPTPPATPGTPPTPAPPIGPTIGSIKPSSKKPRRELLFLTLGFIFIFLFGIAFEKFQIVTLIKSIRLPRVIVVMPTTSPTPASTPSATLMPTPDTVAEWRQYFNEKYAYEFKCPQTSTHTIELPSGDGITKPFFQEVCSDNQNQVRIYVYPSSRTQMATEGAMVKDFISTSKKERIFLRGFNQSYFDQILSTFKLTEPKASSPSAYTCPTSNYVNCTPSPDGMVKKECSAPAFAWYKIHCPTFKGAAL